MSELEMEWIWLSQRIGKEIMKLRNSEKYISARNFLKNPEQAPSHELKGGPQGATASERAEASETLLEEE